MMMELYDISLNMCCLRVFKKFLKVVLVLKKWSERAKNGEKWGKKLDPESAIIHYWGFTPYQRYVSCLTATVHKSMFPGLFFFFFFFFNQYLISPLS